MFKERPELEVKLNKLIGITVKITELCSESHVKISFAVFEAFKELS